MANRRPWAALKPENPTSTSGHTGGKNDAICFETVWSRGSCRGRPDAGPVERCLGTAQAQLRLRPAGDDRLRSRREHLRRKAEGREWRQAQHQPVPGRAAGDRAADAAEAARGRHRLRHHGDRERGQQGAKVLGLMAMGLRNMYSEKEINKVDDIKGLKVRVQATKTEDTYFPAYGA